MALVGFTLVGTGTGAIQDVTLYTVPTGRTLYIKNAHLRAVGALTTSQYGPALFASTSSYYFTVPIAKNEDNQAFSEPGWVLNAGEVLKIETNMPVAAWGVAIQAYLD